jgi:hypothetical protein
MKIRKLIQMRLQERREGISLASDVNVVVAANVGERTSVAAAAARTCGGEEPEQTTDTQRGETNA